MFFFSRGEQVALALLVIGLLAAGGAMWWASTHVGAPPEPFFIDAPATPAGEKITVHVCGEVTKPGLYTVAASTRVNDLIRLAGGPTPRADLAALNLAAEMVDGQQIYLPASRAPGPPVAAATAGRDQPTPAHRPQRQASPPLSRPAARAGKISINRATAADLDRLPGIGPTYARRIIEYRQRLKAETGQGFTRVEQLMEVPGIGPKRFADIKDWVVL